MVERSKEIIRVTHDEGSVILRPNEFSFSTVDLDDIEAKVYNTEYRYRIIIDRNIVFTLKYKSKENRNADFDQIWKIIKEINDNNTPGMVLTSESDVPLVEPSKTDEP